MNFKTTIVLIALLAAGLVFIIVDQFGGSDKDKKTATEDGRGRKLVEIKKDAVDRVTMKPASGATVELVKADGKWNLTQPVAWPAESWDARSLAEDLTELRARGEVKLTKQNLEASGLDQPRYTVEISGGGKTTRLLVGNQAALGNDLYMRVGDEKTAYLVSTSSRVIETFDKKPDKLLAGLRDKSLMQLSSTDVKQLELSRKDGKVVLQKVGDDWKMLQPEQIPADTDEVSDLIRNITNLRADEFIADGTPDAAKAKFDHPVLTAWVSKEAPATQPSTAPSKTGVTVLYGPYEDLLKEKLYVYLPDGAAKAKVSASSASLDKLLKAKPLELRDKRVLNADPAQVSRIQIVTNAAGTTQPTTKPARHDEIVIQRKKVDLTMGPVLPTTHPTTGPTAAATTKPASDLPSTDWEVTVGKKGDAEQAKVRKLLDALHPLKVSKYLEPSTPATKPVANYVLTVNTTSAGGAKSATHVISLTDPGESKPLIGEYNGLKFEINRDIVDKFEGDWANKPTPPSPPPVAEPPGGGFPGMP